jgi:hypothetical protein
MSNSFSNGDYDDGWSWLWCVVWATVVQAALITFCFIVRNVQSMALFLVYLYLPGAIAVAGPQVPLSASTVWILLLLSVAFYSVLFGSLVYFWHRFVLMLRSNGEDRPHTPVPENESENRESQGETSSNRESDGVTKWGCGVSVLIVLYIPLAIYCLFNLDDGGLGSLYERYVYKPAEWLLPTHSSNDWGLLPVLLFTLLIVGTFYSVVIGSVFYFVRWLIEIVFNKRQHRGENNVDSVPDRRSGER